MNMKYRPIIAIDIADKNFDKVQIANPELVVLTSKGNTIDVGSLCYERRGKSVAFKPGGQVLGSKVDRNSLIIERRKSICMIIEYLMDLVRLGSAIETAFGHFKKIVDFYKFCNTLDATKHDIINKDSICLYTAYLIEKTEKSKIAPMTASERQSVVCRLYSSYHGISRDLVYGADNPLIKSRLKHKKQTQPIDDTQLAKSTAFCRSVFEASTKAMDSDVLPYFFDTPEGSGVFSPQIPSLYLEKNKSSFPLGARLAFNFEEGRMNGLDDMKLLPLGLLNERQSKNPSKFMHRFKHASIDSRCNRRSAAHMEMVNLGVSCFFNMFIAATGLNLTTALSLKWSENYLFKEKSQGIREVVVKPRAGYKEVAFSITSVFKPLLIKYLTLREFILNGRESDYLFVVFASKPRPCFDEPVNLSESRYSALRDTVSRRAGIDYIPTARELRATRSDFNIRKHGVFTAAHLNGNNVETTLKHYSNGSKNRAAIALTPFYSKIREAAYSQIKNVEDATVKISDEKSSVGDIDIKTGHCSSFNEPALSIDFKENAPKPSCEKSAHGCLFCENYRIHTSEKDIRKLFSMLECINLIKEKARNLEHFEESWGAVIMRIADIVETVLVQHPNAKEMVARVQSEVTEDGEFDAYWLSHYNMMRELTA